MPILMKVRHGDSDELVDVRYYSTKETAAMLHRSRETVRAKCRSGEWHCLKLGRQYLMNAADIDEAHALMRNDGGEPAPPLQLGIALPPEDIEGVQ